MGLSALAAGVVTGCGASSTSSSSGAAASGAAQSPSATASIAPVFVVLRSNPNGPALGAGGVVLVRPDGSVVKSIDLPRLAPANVGNAAPTPPEQAVVAAGKAYVLDGSGAVHAIDRQGGDVIVARFTPPRPQGFESIAVSPDGSQIMSTIWTEGPDQSPPPSALLNIPVAPSLTLTVDLATAGGAVKTLRTVQRPDATHNDPESTEPTEAIGFVMGWDDAGPIEALHRTLGVQNGEIGGFSSPIAHVDLTTGAPTQPIGGSPCFAFQTLRDGTTLCFSRWGTQTSPPEIRDEGGRLLFAATLPTGYGVDQVRVPHLSPDGMHVALCVYPTSPGATGDQERCVVIGRDGSSIDLPQNFVPAGWADATTVVGEGLSLVRLSTPTNVTSLGVTGTYVGSI